MVKVTEYVSTLPIDSQVVSLNEVEAGTSASENTDDVTDNEH